MDKKKRREEEGLLQMDKKKRRAEEGLYMINMIWTKQVPNNGKELRWAQSPQNGPRVPKGPKHQKT
jgi:hypothetical protein